MRARITKKDGRQGNGGARDQSGRKSLAVTKKFWEKLDAALPETIDYCLEVMRRYAGSTVRSDVEVGLRAAQILISRSPQRVEGTGDEGAITLRIVGADGYKL